MGLWPRLTAPDPIRLNYKALGPQWKIEQYLEVVRATTPDICFYFCVIVTASGSLWNSHVSSFDIGLQSTDNLVPFVLCRVPSQALPIPFQNFAVGLPGMTTQTDLHPLQNGNASHQNYANVLDIYPLSHYYFGSKEAVPLKDEPTPDRLLRIKLNYDARGLRTCVQAVMLVELFKHPHLLLLQKRNSIYELPGGRLRTGESDIECLKRKLSWKLSVVGDSNAPEWEVCECLGMWWRPDFEALLYPYLPPNIKRPKECTKLFLVKLPESQKFVVPRNLKLLAVPLCQIHENHKTYGPVISGVPQLLSKFSFNIIEC